MSQSIVLADVSRSLARFLRKELQADPAVGEWMDSDERISLDSPHALQEDGAVRLSLYLYHVFTDQTPRTRVPMRVEPGPRHEPPLVVNLLYLVTPVTGTPVEQQTLLAAAMRALHRKPLVEGTDLFGAAASLGEPVRLTASPLTLEETARLWQSLGMSHRPSVCYAVRLVLPQSES
ncbi:MAG TPA: DUF4255 domain-containing protein [Bryobacteraceae bacterium]|nr:DUF4255 domain-containing protein [Bryobacteraceae bacterium]